MAARKLPSGAARKMAAAKARSISVEVSAKRLSVRRAVTRKVWPMTRSAKTGASASNASMVFSATSVKPK